MDRITFNENKFELLDGNEENTRKILKKHLPALFNIIPKFDKANCLGVFGRALKSKDISKKPFYVFQYVIEYDKQYFPLHEADYAPVFVFYSEDIINESNKIIVFDAGHYKACWRTGFEAKALKVYGLWHSFIPIDSNYYRRLNKKLKLEKLKEELEIKALTDSKIHKWWDKQKEAKFVIQECLIDPTKIIFNENFRDYDFRSYKERLASFKQSDIRAFLTSEEYEDELNTLLEEALWRELELRILDDYTEKPFEEIQDIFNERFEAAHFSDPTFNISIEKDRLQTEIESSAFFKSRKKIGEMKKQLKKKNKSHFIIFLKTLKNKWPQVPQWIDQLLTMIQKSRKIQMKKESK